MTRWPSSSDSWLSKNAPLSRHFSKKRLMDCLRHTVRRPESVARDGTQAGRTLAHLVTTVQDLSTRGVGLRVLTGQGAQIDTTAAGRAQGAKAFCQPTTTVQSVSSCGPARV